MTDKSGENSGVKKPGTFKKGGDPRQGRGPKKGAPNAGRPPDAFKEMCRGLASSADVEREVRKIIKRGSKDPMFVQALRWASEHGYGKPAQAVTHEVGESLEAMIVRSMGLGPDGQPKE